MALRVTDENYKYILEGGQPVVLDFWAEWCGPCRMITPIIEELATEYDGTVAIGKVDVDENNAIVSDFSIRNIPTILFFKDGQLVDKQVGAAPKSVFVDKIKGLL
ncbi:MAG: thioredoxin [Tannerella sp.]|jgi:thioredoxin 1|nr:thioredoxin [Tannerella sp.]